MATLFCLIFNNTQTEILLAAPGRGWTLPCLDIEGDLDPHDTARLATLVRKELRFVCEPLYAMTIDEAKQRLVLAATTADRKDNGAWFNIAKALHHLDDGWHRELVAAQGTTAGTPIVPWIDSDFRMEAMAWVTDQLAVCNMSLTSDIEHVKSSFVGWIARADTDAGRIFFKAAPGVYCREMAITAMLSAWQPDYIPRPLAVDMERQWMLTREACGPTLAEVDRVETWEDTLRCYARLQRASIASLAGQADSPLYDYRPEALSERIDWMTAELKSLQRGYLEPLDSDEVRALRGSGSLLKELCLQVADAGIPSALEHGDLHPGNIRITEHCPVFLDWAWSSITHPFLSLSLLLHERKIPAGLRDERHRLLQAYLDEWTDFAPAASLEPLARLVDRWRVIHHAVGDAEWVAAIKRQLGEASIHQDSYIAWTLRQRQYQMVKTWRRLLALREA